MFSVIHQKKHSERKYTMSAIMGLDKQGTHKIAEV